MIHEEIVKFGTAKLLRDAGFSQKDEDGVLDTYKFYTETGELTDGQFDFDPEIGDVAAPTQAQAMRWLREDKGIFVNIRFDRDVYDDKTTWWAYETGVMHPFEIEGWSVVFESYEEACEDGIQAACKRLIKKGDNQ